MKKQTLAAVLTMSLISVAAGAQSPTDETYERVVPELGKPSAALNISRDVTQVIDVNVRQTLNVTIVPAYFSGKVNVQVSTSDGLVLLSDARVTRAMSGKPIVLPIDVLADHAGEHRLNIVASVDGGYVGLQQNRAYTSTVVAGAVSAADVEQSTSQKATAVTQTTAGEQVIVRKATETVR